MYEFVTEETLAQYESFIRLHPNGHFAQSSLWGKQKSAWQFRAIMVRDQTGAVRGSMSFLIRKVPVLGISLLYACRGPVCDEDDTETLHELIRGAKELAREVRGYAIKIDPAIASSHHRFAEQLHSLGFRQKDRGKGFAAAQPRYVFRLDTAGKTEEALLAGMSQKCRYNLRTAVKKGVEVRICGEETVPEFAALMELTGKRDHFVTRNADYFRNLLRNLGSHARLYMAYLEGEAIAGALAIQFGDKTWYLYGASANAHRNCMPNYLLQWEMIRWSLAGGCRIYDFRGVSGNLTPSDPLYGLYQFKKGFGGEFTEFIGEMDLVLNPIAYHAVELALHLRRKLLSHRA